MKKFLITYLLISCSILFFSLKKYEYDNLMLYGNQAQSTYSIGELQ